MPDISDLSARPIAGGMPPQIDGTPASASTERPSRIRNILGRYVDEVFGTRRSSAPIESPSALREAVEVALAPDSGLYLSKSGYLVGRTGQERPANAIEQGDLLFRAAMIEEDDAELFKNPKIVLAQKEAALASLVGAFIGATGDLVGTNGYQNKEQMLQARSCAAPLILDLALSLDDDAPKEAALKKKALDEYLRCLKLEPHGLNRNFMIYDLDRSLSQLPRDVRAVTEQLMLELDPKNPPYDAWFKDGNNTLKIDYHVGDGFWEEELAGYVENGFQRKNNDDGTVTLTKRYEERGVVTNVEMRMTSGPDGLFRRMNDPGVQIVAYSGHADYGRNVQRQIASGSPLIGSKVFFGLQCGGKGIHNDILGKYGDLQLVQSRNASYGFEDRRTLLNALDGFAKRASWVDISATNARKNSDNYYYPSDTLVRRRAEDTDGDGRADAWDRVVNYNAFRPQAAITEQLTAIDPGKPVSMLEGRPIHGALMRFNRLAGYNEWAKELQDQRFMDHGYYDGKREDPIIRVKEIEPDDDGPRFRVDVNKWYAHAEEETLGAAMHFELGMYCAKRAGLRDADAKGSGLLMAAKCLNVDNGYLDNEVWRAMLAHYGLPAGISLSETTSIALKDEHMAAGTSETLRALKERLSARGISL